MQFPKILKTATELVLASLIALVIIIVLHSSSAKEKFNLPPLKHKPFGTPTNTKTDYKAIIRLSDARGREYCSGFVLDANYAATAAHCLVEGESSTLRTDPILIADLQNRFTGVVAQAAGVALRSDLGLIQGNFARFKALPANLETYGFDEDHNFITCGFPYLQNRLVCTEFVPLSNEGFAVVGHGYLVPGMSGGPVIDITTGKAVGLNSATGIHVIKVFPLEGFLGAFNL